MVLPSVMCVLLAVLLVHLGLCCYRSKVVFVLTGLLFHFPRDLLVSLMQSCFRDASLHIVCPFPILLALTDDPLISVIMYISGSYVVCAFLFWSLFPSIACPTASLCVVALYLLSWYFLIWALNFSSCFLTSTSRAARSIGKFSSLVLTSRFIISSYGVFFVAG